MDRKYVFTFYPVSQFAEVQFCHKSCLPGGSREQDTAAGEDYRIHGHQQNNGEGEASEQRNRLLPDSSWQREGRKLEQREGRKLKPHINAWIVSSKK